MDFFFYGLPFLLLAGALFMTYRVVRRWIQMRAAWNSGLTAEGRCLRTYTTTQGGGHARVTTVLHHVYEFTARDGRAVRFEEEGGPATTVEGDFVTVHYADGPRVVATAHRPGRFRHTATALGAVAFLGVVMVFCVGFLSVYSRLS